MAGLNDHKAKLMIMLMGKKKPGDAPMPDEDEPSLSDEGKKAAMQAMIDAFKADDVDAALEAHSQLEAHEE